MSDDVEAMADEMVRAVIEESVRMLRMDALEFPPEDAVLGRARDILIQGADHLQLIGQLSEQELNELDAVETVSADAAREYLDARVERLG